MDSAHSGLTIHLFYNYLILNFGNLAVLETIIWYACYFDIINNMILMNEYQ